MGAPQDHRGFKSALRDECNGESIRRKGRSIRKSLVREAGSVAGGAMLGAAVGGPVGALFGAGVGLFLGQQANKARSKDKEVA